MARRSAFASAVVGGWQRLVHFKSIRSKVSFYLLLVAAVPTLLISYVSYTQARDQIRDELLSHLSGVVSLKREAIDQWYQERRQQVRLLREHPEFQSTAAAILQYPFQTRRSLDAYQAFDSLLRVYVGAESAYDEIFLMDSEGRIFYSTETDAEGRNKGNRLYFKKGLEDFYIQQMYHSLSMGRTATTIALPISADGHVVIGVLAVRLRVGRLADIMNTYAGLGSKSVTYLVNSYNYFLTDPRGLSGYAMIRTNYSAHVRRCLQRTHTTETGEFVNFRNREVLTAYTYLPRYELCVVSETEAETAYRTVTRLRGLIVLVTLVLLLLVIVIAFAVSASISLPIRQLTRATAYAATGDLEQHIEVALHDEVGTLANSFNKMIDSLHDRTEELARSNADLEEFAYVVSHDLKEPLRSVTGFLRLLDQRYRADMDEKAQRYVGQACMGAVRMQRLIDDLLSYSRLGSDVSMTQLVDIADILSQVLTALSKAVRESGATVEVGELPEVQAEPVLLACVFQNLVGNAIKFRGSARPLVRVTAERMDDNWHFSIQDNGVGIAAGDQDKVFMVFRRLHSAQDYDGTGIGLAVCKKIIERHGGRIWLESEVDRGTTVHFTIPG